MNTNQKVVYQSGLLSLIEMQTNRGKRVSLDMGGDAVLIIPRTKEGNYVLTVQTRHGKKEEVYEFPSGGIRDGETPQDAATRELLEETGAFGKMQFLTTTEPLSGLVKFKVHIFYSDIETMSKEKMNLDKNEKLETVELSHDELITKILSFNIIDGYILLGLGALFMFSDK
ncbi:MAG: NUDIX hydrolase [Candidatus Pacebacteria bacterium]|nr:NUDIX hydrolase [Candidatus Paceibacterota bacterium]